MSRASDSKSDAPKPFLYLATGERVSGHFFVSSGTVRHSGQERIGDLLNAENGFFPFEVLDEDRPKTLIYNRAHVVTVTVSSDEARQYPGYDMATPRAVSLLLSTRQRLTGTILIDQPGGINASATGPIIETNFTILNDAQTKADLAAVDAGPRAHVFEVAVDVVVQPVAAEGIPDRPGVHLAHGDDGPRRVVHHEEIEVAVPVVVEEGCVCGPATVGDAERRRHLLEGRHAVRIESLVDEQLVGTIRRIDFARVADVDVEPAVAVDVGKRNPGCPGPRPSETGLVGDVPEMKFSLVQIQPDTALIRAEHDFGQTVARKVADCDAAAVVVVAVGENVVVARVGEPVFEPHARVACA